MIPTIVGDTVDELTIKLVEYDPTDPLAVLYRRVLPSLAKVEVVKHLPDPDGGDIPCSTGTAFMVTGNEFLTAKHVLGKEAPLDFWLVDPAGAIHEAEVIPTGDFGDLMALRLSNPEEIHAFSPLTLVPVDSIVGEQTATVGFADGYNLPEAEVARVSTLVERSPQAKPYIGRNLYVIPVDVSTSV